MNIQSLVFQLADDILDKKIDEEEALQRLIRFIHERAYRLDSQKREIDTILEQRGDLNRSPDKGFFIYSLVRRWAEQLKDDTYVFKVKKLEGVFAILQTHHEKAKKILEECQNFFLQNDCLLDYGIVTSNIGNIYRRESNFSEAEKYYSTAINALKKTKDQEQIVGTMSNLVVIYKNQCRWLDLKRVAKEVLDSCEKHNLMHKAPIALDALGHAAREERDICAAIGYHSRSVQLGKPDTLSQAKSISNLAAVYNLIGDFDKAIKLYNKAILVFEKYQFLRGVAQISTDLGIILYRRGLFSQAMENFESALNIARKHPFKQEQLIALGEKANIFDACGEKRTAIRCYEDAIDIATETELVKSENIYRIALGNCYRSIGLLDEAQKQYEQANRVGINMQSSYRQKSVKGQIAQVLDEKQHYQKAEDLLKECIEYSSSVDDQFNLCIYKSHLAEIKCKRDGSFDPTETYLEILNIQQKCEERDQELSTIRQLCKYYLNKKDYSKSLEYSRKAKALLETLRRTTQLGPITNKFVEDKMDIYEVEVLCLLCLGQTERAWMAVERLKARFISDHIDKASSSYQLDTPNAVWQDYLDIQKSLEDKLILQQMYWQDETTQKPSIEEIKELQQKLQIQIEKIKGYNPNFAENVSPGELKLQELQHKLTSDQVVVEFFVSEEETVVFLIGHSFFEKVLLPLDGKAVFDLGKLWSNAITATKVLDTYHLYREDVEDSLSKREKTNSAFQKEYYEGKIKRETELFIANFLEGCASSARIDDFRQTQKLKTHLLLDIENYHKSKWRKTITETMQRLSKYLSPLSEKLSTKNCSKLIFILHRELQVLPLGLLSIGNGYLQDTKTIQYAPSSKILLQVLSRSTRKEDREEFLGVAANRKNHPNYLAFIYPEVESAERLFKEHKIDTKTFVDQDTKRADVINHMKKSSYLHFSCHGSFVGNFLRSGLHLHEETITMSDIFNASLENVQLAILSACETATNEGLRSSEYISIASCFVCAGCRHVIASLWVVDDLAMYLLVTKFVDEFLKTKNVYDSLRSSQQWLRSLSGQDVISALSKDSSASLEKNIQNLFPMKASILEEGKAKVIAKQLYENEGNNIFSSPHYWAGVIVL